MSKKRVHELAKELKNHGIELSNAELVEKLHALGYDVKSHSSSLEDDQATAAFEKILAEKKPKPAPVKASGPGFVVRKRAAVEAAAPVPPPVPVPEPVLEEPMEEEPLEAAGEESPLAVEPEVLPEPEAVPAPPLAVSPEAEVPAVAVAANPAPPASEPRPATPAVTPAGPVVTHVRAPSISAAGSHPTVTMKPAVPMPPSGPNAKPTATQAVLVSRPLIPVRRVTPPSTQHRAIPLAPGPRALGEVREFKVVPGSLGRDREFIDVSKDKNKRRSVRTDRDTPQSGKELLTAALADRAYVPVRGKKKKATKKGQKTQITEMAERKKVIRIEEGMSLSELSQTLGVKAAELIKRLMKMGKMATINQILDADTVGILATDFGFTVEKKGFEVEEFIPEAVEDDAQQQTRPPVVTVMGHVDHGKTSLLDAIRKADVAAGEAGGITQHIGAYSVTTPKGPITFLDTPGHEAFTSMRQRGAQVTDIVVLVVAADDGVMPQTVEAIKHAKEADVTILVAINKVDKPGATPERVMQQLTEHQLVAEKWGGDTIMVPVSARTKQGIDELLENIALQAEVLELKANPEKLAAGTVIEAKIEKGRGPVATVLVQEGTLRVGDPIVTGAHSGRVRAMMNDRGEQVKEVLPGWPVEVLGLDGVPTAGDDFNVVESEKAAAEIAEHRAMKARQKELGNVKKATLEDLFAKADSANKKELNIVVKADVQGSAEAVAQALAKLATKKVGVKVVYSAVGPVNESDVQHAAASKAVIVGFNVKPETKVEAVASQEAVDIRLYNVIYEAADDIRKVMEGLLEPIIKEKPLGRAEVRQLFNVPKIGVVAGSSVIDGVIRRTAHARVLRDKKPVFSGKIASLKRLKDDVREVQQGFECGIGVENFGDIKPGDIIEAFELEEIRQSLE
jgi:translation initiation factor IF-2